MSKKGSIIITAMTIASVFGIVIGSALSSTVSQASLQKRVLANTQARQIASSAMFVSLETLKARINSGEDLDGKTILLDPPSPNLYGPTTYGLSNDDAELVQTSLTDAASGAEIEIVVPDAVPSKKRYHPSSVGNVLAAGAGSIYREREQMIKMTETLGALRNIDVYMRAKVKIGGLNVETRLKQTLANRVHTSARLFSIFSYPDIELVSAVDEAVYQDVFSMGDIYLYPISLSGGQSVGVYKLSAAGKIYRRPIFPKEGLTPKRVIAGSLKKFHIASGGSSAPFNENFDSDSDRWLDEAPSRFGGSIRDGALGVQYQPMEGFDIQYLPEHKAVEAGTQRLNPYYQILQPLQPSVQDLLHSDPLFDQKIAGKTKWWFRVSEDGNVTAHKYVSSASGVIDITNAFPAGIIGAAKQDYSGIETDLVAEEYMEETDEVTGTPIDFVQQGLYDTRQDKKMNLVTIDIEALKQALLNSNFGPGFNAETLFNGLVYVEFPMSNVTRPDGVKPLASDTLGLQLINCKDLQHLKVGPSGNVGHLGTVCVATNAPLYVHGDVNPIRETGGFQTYLAAESLTFLSNNWDHESRRYSKKPIDTQEVIEARTAAAGQIRANIIAGIVPTPFDGTNLHAYSGGMPSGLIRHLETWANPSGGSKELTIYGSICCLFESEVHRKLLARKMNASYRGVDYKYLGAPPKFNKVGGAPSTGAFEVFPTFHTYRNTSMRVVSKEEFDNL